VRYARGGVLVVSRIDPAAKQEYLAAFNNTGSTASVRVQTATPSASWSALLGSGGATSDAKGSLSVTIPAVGAVLLKAGAAIRATAPAKPKLKVGADDLTSLTRATATVAGTTPVSVAFLVRKPGGAWRRLDVDTSPPYRGFFTKAKRSKLQVVAVARSLDGRTATSAVVTVR
jgi:hypothetical protein